MKVVILAGGLGTRISEESHLKPKPMIEIGGKPILWHIMKGFSKYGYNDFIICSGYKQDVIKEWFNNYFLHTSDITFDFTNGNKMQIHNNISEPWKVTIIDTGLNTMTGGRIKRIGKYLDNEPFLLTYGDGVSDINIDSLVKFHFSHSKLATLTSIQPDGRFGILDIEDNQVKSFREKNKKDMGWTNGGFMVLNHEVLDYIKGDETVFEREPLENLVTDGQLMTYKHHGFWQCMDTLRDKEKLEDYWNSSSCPWKTWI
jgi:glucose-1-phosphate cytidylyltransferase